MDAALAAAVLADARKTLAEIDSKLVERRQQQWKLQLRLGSTWYNYLAAQLELHADILRTAVLFSLFIGVGVSFGVVCQEFTFTEAVYFAITSLSTAGLKGIVSGGGGDGGGGGGDGGGVEMLGSVTSVSCLHFL